MKSSAELKNNFKSIFFNLLPLGYVKGFMDDNTNTSYISLIDGEYIYNCNNYNSNLERFKAYDLKFNTLEELEKSLMSFEVLDDDCYEITEEQYIMFSNIHNLKEQY